MRNATQPEYRRWAVPSQPAQTIRAVWGLGRDPLPCLDMTLVGVIPAPGQWPEGGKPKMAGVPQEPNQRKAAKRRRSSTAIPGRRPT